MPADTLFTERLLLRLLNPEIYKEVMSTFGDDAIMQYFGLTTTEELQQEKQRFSEGMTMAGRSFLYFHLIEKKSLVVMGWCGYHTWFTRHRRAEIGYVLNEDRYKGKGYMREALPVVLSYGFEKMNLHRIEAIVAPGNEPSIKLVKRLGFTEEGLLREHYMKNNKLEDSIMFSLLQTERGPSPDGI
jgi:[ribosomal protein S5]-alanine N-acetyltransferase